MLEIELFLVELQRRILDAGVDVPWKDVEFDLEDSGEATYLHAAAYYAADDYIGYSCKLPHRVPTTVNAREFVERSIMRPSMTLH